MWIVEVSHYQVQCAGRQPSQLEANQVVNHLQPASCEDTFKTQDLIVVHMMYQMLLKVILRVSDLVLFRLEAKTNSVRPKSPIDRTIPFYRRLNTRTKTMTKVWINSKRTNQSNRTQQKTQ